MSNYPKTIFIDRLEGKIVLFGCLVYLAAWAIHAFNPGLLGIPPFYALMSPFVAVALVLIYFKMGGFRRDNFESGWFNTSVLIVVLLTPFLASAFGAIRR